MNAYNSQRVGAGTVAMGIAAGALELALDWAKTREQFGRPIGEFQGLQWMLADMQTQLTASRLMLYAAARSRGPDGSAFPDPMLAAQAKIFASETAIKIVNDALQLFGARGYSRELPLERMARDVRMFTIGGGTAQVLRTLVASQDARLEAAADARRLCAEALDARRRGVTMHPIFAKRRRTQRCRSCSSPPPISTDATEILDDRERAFVRAAGYEPKPGRHLIVPAADGKLAGVLFGLEDADEPVKDLFRPGATCPACCRRAPTASPMRRTTRGLPRSPSRSAPINSPATARRRRATCGWWCRTASTARISSRIVEGVTLAAISSTRRRTTWARPNWKRPRARSPSSTAPKFDVTARRRAGEEFPADPRGRRAARRARRG